MGLTMADPALHANACWNSGEFETGPITRYFEIAWESDFTICRCTSVLSAAPRYCPQEMKNCCSGLKPSITGTG